MSVDKKIIISQMELIAREHGKKLVLLKRDLPLLETGLNSLAIAILVARLEDILRVIHSAPLMLSTCRLLWRIL